MKHSKLETILDNVAVAIEFFFALVPLFAIMSPFVFFYAIGFRSEALFISSVVALLPIGVLIAYTDRSFYLGLLILIGMGYLII